jgi:hypothetical protein
MFLRLLLLLTVLASGSTAKAAPFEATLIHLKGKAIRAEKERIPLAEGDRIAPGERVRVLEGVALLKTSDGSVLKLLPKTEIEIGDPESPGARLHTGAVFTRVPQGKSGRIKFRIRTRAAVMGVRGTEFYTSYGKSEKEVWMCVNEGEVSVETLNAEKQTVPVHAGEGVWVKEGAPPPVAKPYEWTRKLNWNLDPEHGKLEDDTRPDGAYSNPLRVNYD